MRILIGGSPCTHWSICQTRNRETKAEGLGWELFNNYCLAKKFFKPDLFLYENNASASPLIKAEIEKALGVNRVEIDSALLSAQTRKRFYCFNWDVTPVRKSVLTVTDILESRVDKSYFVDAPFTETDGVKNPTQPIRCGYLNGSTGQGCRVYSIKGKSVCINANGGGWGAKTGLYKVRSGIRRLTPVECERLQCLPDGYTDVEGISEAQRYKQIGNGWTASVIMHLLKSALKNVNKKEKIQVLSMYDGIATGRYCLDKLGFRNIDYYALEIDNYAIDVALANYPDIIELGDAFQIRDASFRRKFRRLLNV